MSNGHNSIDGTQLQSLVDRIERLASERAELADDIKEVYAEAKSGGFDTKIMRKVIARRKRDKAELAEEEEMIEAYMRALGQLADTPLGQASVRRATGRAAA